MLFWKARSLGGPWIVKQKWQVHYKLLWKQRSGCVVLTSHPGTATAYKLAYKLAYTYIVFFCPESASHLNQTKIYGTFDS